MVIRFFLIVDNLRVHHGKMVQKWVSEHKNEIELFFFPDYCPDLNPDEYLNNIMKEELQRQVQPHNTEELTIKMRGILKKLQRNQTKIKNIFKNENILYAVASARGNHNVS